MPTVRCHPRKHKGPLRLDFRWKLEQRPGIGMRSGACFLLMLLLLSAAASVNAFTRGSGDPLAGMEQPSQSLPVAPTSPALDPGRYVRLAQNAPVLHAARVFLMEPGTEIPLPIQVEAMPRNSFLRLRGLPPNATLSEGHEIGPGAWAVPLVSLPSIRVRVPPGTSGKFEVTISAVNVAGDVLSELTATLVVGPSSSLLSGILEQPREARSPAPLQPPAPALAERTEPQPPSRSTGMRPNGSKAGSQAQPPMTSGSPAGTRASAPSASGKSCGAAEISTAPLPAGRMSIRIKGTSCRGNEPVTIEYAGARLVRRLDHAGALDLTLDCFAGTGSKAEIFFSDGARGAIDVTTSDLGRLSKVAVIWQAPVNLDLHAYEYAAAHGEPGHIWASSPSSPDDAWEKTLASGRGHGFITAHDGSGEGDKYEVYTLWHHEDQTSGTIELALDFKSRGDTPSGEMCGNGPLSQIAFEVVTLSRRGEVTREQAVLLPMECGSSLAHSVRYNKSVIPVLRIRR